MNLDALVAQLKIDEGFRPLAYDDATGKPVQPGSKLIGCPTIGYGWNLASDPIAEEDAAARLTTRAMKAQADAMAMTPGWDALTDARQRALANMAYNLGAHGLANFHDLFRALDRGDHDAAADAILDSVAARQAPDRYHRIASAMRTGVA